MLYYVALDSYTCGSTYNGTFEAVDIMDAVKQARKCFPLSRSIMRAGVCLTKFPSRNEWFMVIGVHANGKTISRSYTKKTEQEAIDQFFQDFPDAVDIIDVLDWK